MCIREHVNVTLTETRTVTKVIVAYVLATASYYAVLPLSDIVDFSHEEVVDGFATQFGSRALGMAHA